jgi:hypothetical protein
MSNRRRRLPENVHGVAVGVGLGGFHRISFLDRRRIEAAGFRDVINIHDMLLTSNRRIRAGHSSTDVKSVTVMLITLLLDLLLTAEAPHVQHHVRHDH